MHYINVSQEYVKEVEADYMASGGAAFRSDMNVMLASSINIRGVMERIDTDLGYQWEDREADGCVRIGVNWGVYGIGTGFIHRPGSCFGNCCFPIACDFYWLSDYLQYIQDFRQQ